MDQGQIVVSRSPQDGGKVRTGALLKRSGSVMTVRWDDDGREEQVRISRDATFVVPGTLRHQAFVDPDGLTARLESDPVSVFVQLLREHGQSLLSAVEIKQKLFQYGLDEQVLDRAWKRAQTRLKEHDQVRILNKKYRWRAPKREETNTPAGDRPETTGAQTEPAGQQPEQASVQADAAGVQPQSAAPQKSPTEGRAESVSVQAAPAEARPEPADPRAGRVEERTEPVSAQADPETQPEPAAPQGDQAEEPTLAQAAEARPDSAEPQVSTAEGRTGPAPVQALAEAQPESDAPQERRQEPAHSAAETPAVPDAPEQEAVSEQAAPEEAEPDDDRPLPWHQAVAAALRDGPMPDGKTYSRHPLATAVRLGRLDDDAIKRLLKSVREDDRAAALALLAALPRAARPVDARMADADSAALRAAMVMGADELRKAQPVGRELTTAAVRLLDRAASQPVPDQTVPAMIRLAGVVAADPGRDSLDALDRVAKVVGDRLARMPDKSWDTLDLGAVARLAALLPFTRQGGRAAVLAAVARARPERITEEIWWRGATLTALAESAAGLLGRVTARPDVAERIIAPLMARELPKVSTRVRLAGLLGLPTEFVEHLPPEGVAAAFRRVAVGDPAVEAWMRLLAQEDRIARLEDELERARADARRAAEQAEQTEARRRELLAQYERLEARLRETHGQSVAMRASQERQVKIDAVRSLADLAAEVEELAAGKAEPEVMVERVRVLVSDQGLEPIGDVGAETPFDREAHEALVGAPRDGQAVTVLRPGYRWRSDGEDLVLSRALVSDEM